MTDGTSQGLFIVVAIVIFGIFVVLAYILFEDTLSPALASMFGDATEQARYNLMKEYDPETVVKFQDPNLKTIIFNQLTLEGHSVDTENITIGDMLKLKVVNLRKDQVGEMEITSIEGLQYAKNLKKLVLIYQKSISDFSFLDSFRNLEELDLGMTNFASKDFVHLKNLKELKRMNVGTTKVTTLDGIPYFPKILSLIVDNRDTPNLNGLLKLKTLKSIAFYNMPLITDEEAAVLSILPELQTIHANNTSITDAKIFLDFPRLSNINLRETHVTLEDVNLLRDSGITVTY